MHACTGGVGEGGRDRGERGRKERQEDRRKEGGKGTHPGQSKCVSADPEARAQVCLRRKAQAVGIQKSKQAGQEMGAVVGAPGAPKTVMKPQRGVLSVAIGLPFTRK